MTGARCQVFPGSWSQLHRALGRVVRVEPRPSRNVIVRLDDDGRECAFAEEVVVVLDDSTPHMVAGD